MIRYFFRRILQLIPVIIAVSFIVFALMDMIPGDIMSGWNLDNYSEAEIAALRADLGLDDPLLIRYGRYMFRLVQGDLGYSDVSGINVLESFLTRLPNTLLLASCAFILGVAIAIPMGVKAARRAGTLTDNLTTAVTMIGMSMPGFWLGILLILLFSYKLRWFPTGGFKAGAISLVLPAIAAAASLVATCTRQTRSSMLEVLRSDYLRTARAKGVPERVVIRKHALGNALIPIVTSVGMALSGALAGSAVIETVFAWPGVGRLVVESVFARDVTATTGTVILTTIIYCLVQLMVDLTYAFIDPRIKAQFTSKNKAKRRAANPVAKASSELQHTASQGEIISGSDMEITGAWDKGSSSGIDEAGFAQAGSMFPAQESESLQDTASIDFVAVTNRMIAEEDMEDNEEVATNSSELITKKYRKRSQFGEVVHHLLQNKGAIAGLVVIFAMFVLFVVSLLIPFEAMVAANVSHRFFPPSFTYPFGTDAMGRNLFIRVMYAARFSLPIGVGATLVATTIGVLLGTHASYYGGVVDDVIMRISDTFASVPGLITGMVIVSVLGRSLLTLIIAVGVAAVPIFIRTSRGATLSVRDNEFVEAAKAIGLSNFRIMFTQVLPNGMAPILISFSIALGNSILISASLSYLGFGIPVPNPEWGSLVAAGRDVIRTASWLTTFPGLFIMATVMGFNMLGDGLRDALDPKLKK
ncbi:MAG: ABC transporter permease subunit [Peptococcaceae bacterium]|nr:ABC transporter permease subunit [Peptococcaceae bacterium]